MAFVFRRLITPHDIPSSIEEGYKSPVNQRTTISACSVCNHSGTSVSVTIEIVESGGVPGNGKKVWADMPLAVGQSQQVFELLQHTLEPGDTIHWYASAADAVSVHMSGVLNPKTVVQ